MEEQQFVALVSSFVGGFVMTWLRGYGWFGEGLTYLASLLGGALCAWLLGAHDGMSWAVGIMSHTLTILGGVHVGGGAARARAATNLPAHVLPKYNEISNGK